MKLLTYFLLGLSIFAWGQNQNPSFSKLDASPLDVVMYRNADNEAVARVIYSRPSKRDRVVFGGLVPYGQVWRTGANEATEITFFKPVSIDEKKVPAGSYSVFTIPGEDEWIFILNKDTFQWGTQYDESKNLLTTTAEAGNMPSPAESFSITFLETIDGPAIFLGWDQTYISVPFEVQDEVKD